MRQRQCHTNVYRLLLSAIAVLVTVAGYSQDDSLIFPDKEISRAEAIEIAGRVAAHAYNPDDYVSSYRCEFEPRFIDTTDFFLQGSGGENPEYYVPEGARVGIFDFAPFVMQPFRDEGLSRARKAEFFWKKYPPKQPQEAFPVAVVLHDEQRQRLDIHPGVNELLALALMYRDPGFAGLFQREHPGVTFRLDTSGTESRLLKVFEHPGANGHPASLSAWQLTFTPDDEPVTFEEIRWSLERGREDGGMYHRYARLGDAPFLGVVQQGRGNDAREYGWRQVDGVWVIDRIRGGRPDLTAATPGAFVPWELELKEFELNPELNDALFELPEVPAPSLDLSTPERAIETILRCLRSRRFDLLQHCHIEKTAAPIQSRIPHYNNYFFDVYPELDERLVVESQWQDGDAWVYRVLIPQPLRTHRRARDIRLVPTDGEWRMDADIGLLHLAFYD
jgi:hypothetical protein